MREAITTKILLSKLSSIEDGIIAAPLVYRLPELGPISRSSKTVRVCSLNHFEAFLLMKKIPECNELNENDVTNATIFKEFGSYLVDIAMVSVGGFLNSSESTTNLKPKSQLGSSTAGEYIGQERQHFFRRKSLLIYSVTGQDYICH